MRKPSVFVLATIVAVVSGGIAGAVATPGAPASGARVRPARRTAFGPDDVQTYISPVIVLRYWLANIDQAPAALRPQLRSAKAMAARAPEVPSRPRNATAGPGVLGDVFNLDGSGLPQNEESVAVCENRPEVVLGGTNDFRSCST